MRIYYPALCMASLVLTIGYSVLAQTSLPPDGTTCALAIGSCNHSDFQPANDQGNSGCFSLQNQYCGDNSKLACTFCNGGPPGSFGNVCVQDYNGTGCITDDGSIECGDSFKSICVQADGGFCECSTEFQVDTGNACSYPTCTGSY